MGDYGLSLSYFEPFKTGSEECGQNGLPVCPNSTKIIGNGYYISLKSHETLQELVHVEKGKLINYRSMTVNPHLHEMSYPHLHESVSEHTHS